ncbi:MAG: NUDIX domain-containing protein [Cytophagales bacterium]
MLGSAKRELLEETGITAARWESLSKVHLSNSVSDEVGYIYLAKRAYF